MKFITVQPDSDFYVWQCQVQMNNFRRLGIEKDSIILFGFDGKINARAEEFASKTEAKVYFYPDHRKSFTSQYPPSIQPHILRQFFERFPDIGEFMYLDCDVIFLDMPDLSALPEGFVHESDTKSYLETKYILSKGNGLLKGMASIVGVSPDLVIENDINCGGAQHVFKSHVDAEFWGDVEVYSAALFDYMEATSSIYKPEDPIQSWTAGMWALNWLLWKRGIKTRIAPELDFVFATCRMDNLKEKKIMHNAGVTPDRMELFNKGEFVHKSPFDCTFENVSDEYCSRLYVNEILSTRESLRS